ncbi:hypothetical protein [Gordonia sp. (in: high G+C Gram-positive bacteria)]|uniref:hypothetical protein n=1 Tax=Gordonia sp. (in: high G+C Gram-positive bacteria) TaxID=84139 RepID=UPI00333F26DB
MSEGAALPLLSACLRAPAPQVADVLRTCRPDDVRLIDAPTAAALDICLELAESDRAPDATLVNAELQRRGLYSHHTGELTRNRLFDAVSPAHQPELLPEYAAVVLATVLRARFTALGEALTEGAETATEDDLWETLTREGKKARETRDRLTRCRGGRA